MCNDMFPGLNSMQGLFETLTLSWGVLLEIISVFILCFQVRYCFIAMWQTNQGSTGTTPRRDDRGKRLVEEHVKCQHCSIFRYFSYLHNLNNINFVQISDTWPWYAWWFPLWGRAFFIFFIPISIALVAKKGTKSKVGIWYFDRRASNTWNRREDKTTYEPSRNISSNNKKLKRYFFCSTWDELW